MRVLLRFWLVFVVLLILLLGLNIYLITSRSAANITTTDLKDKSLSVRQSAAKQLTVEIKNLPDSVSKQDQAVVMNRVAILLRQNYGRDMSSATASVRQSVGGFDTANYFELYVDVIPQNITYLAVVDSSTHNVSISCAPQYLQLDQDSSTCNDNVTLSVFDFPKG